MAFTSQQAVPFGQRLLLRFSLPARRLWRRALLRPIGSAEGAGPRAWCLRGAGRVGSRVESHGWLSRRLPRPRRCATLAWGAVGVGGRSAAQRSGAEWGVLGMTHAPEVRWHGGSVGVCGGRSHFRVVGGQSAASAAGCCQSGAREKCQRTWTRDAQVQIVHGDIGATKRRSSCTEGQTGDSGSV